MIQLYAFADEASPDIGRQIAALQRNALNGLEIRNVDGQNVSAISLKKAREVYARLSDAGLIVWSVGSPIGKIDLRADDFEAHVSLFRHTLDIAHALEAKNLRMFSFYMPRGCDVSGCRQEVIDRLGRLLDLSRGSGITLCHENEKGIYGDVASRCAELHAALPELSAVFDPANFVQCGQDTLSAWEMLREHVRYLHIKDALKDGTVVPAGCGDGHVREIVQDYLGRGGCAMTLEPHLRSFDGLSSLERENLRTEMNVTIYETNDAAFDAAAAALKACL